MGDDEISFTGPLNRFVLGSQGLAATWYHKQVGQWIVLALVVLHIGALLYYLLRRKDNLIRAMVVGDKTLERPAPESRDTAATRLLATVVLALCGGPWRGSSAWVGEGV